MSNLAPFAYFGGKWRILSHVLQYVPPLKEVDCYVEPFFGSGTLFFNRARLGKNEIVNDQDAQLYNFYKVLQDPRQYAKLTRLLKYTPYSRQFFLAARELIKKNQEHTSSVRRAWAVYILYCMSTMNNKTSFSRGSLSAPEGRYWVDNHDRLDYCAARLQGCLIEHEDALLTCQRNDSKKTFIYLDPPYLIVRDMQAVKKTYDVMSKKQHTKLLEFCLEAKSRILISGYASQLYDDMLGGWYKTEVKSFTTTVRNQRGRSAHAKTLEILWCNFKPTKQEQLF